MNHTKTALLRDTHRRHVPLNCTLCRFTKRGRQRCVTHIGVTSQLFTKRRWQCYVTHIGVTSQLYIREFYQTKMAMLCDTHWRHVLLSYTLGCSKRGRQWQPRQAMDLFLRNPCIFCNYFFSLGTRSIFDYPRSSSRKDYSYRKVDHGNGAVEFSYESRVAQMSSLMSLV